MRVDVRRLLIVFGFERANEALYDLALVGRIELHDADIAKRCFARLLLETERQPNRAELDRLSSPALRNASLGECLRDAQPLPLERVGRDHIHLAETGDASCDRGEVVHIATEADITQDFPAERLERVSEDLRITDARIGVFVEQHCRARVEALVSISGDVDALHDLVGHDAKRPRVAGIGDFDRGGACVEKRHLRLLHEPVRCLACPVRQSMNPVLTSQTARRS